MSESLCFWRAVRCSGFFHSAKRAPLQIAGGDGLPGAPRLVPDLAADLVQRVGCERHDVEGVQAQLGLRAAL